LPRTTRFAAGPGRLEDSPSWLERVELAKDRQEVFKGQDEAFVMLSKFGIG
jgi:hypothetical protein